MIASRMNRTLRLARAVALPCGRRYMQAATATKASNWSQQHQQVVAPKSWFHASSVEPAAAAAAQEWSHTLSFASPESDFCTGHDHRFKASPFSQQPRTLAQALLSPLPCVVTTKTYPHTIVSVNAAWEDLCGYTLPEVHHQTLAVIQGAATNTELAHATVEKVANDASRIQDMYVVNYKKSGQAFTNHVTLSTLTLSEDQPDVQFLVGVLEPVHHVPLRLVD
jgi:PAS domain-containing protein